MPRNKITMFALLVLCSFEFASAQGGINTQLVGQLRTRGTNGYSNCWGYTAPGGKEYAIMGCFNGTQIVDISSDTLKEVAFIPGPASAWREMKVYQHYAYVVTEGAGAGLQIIDLDSMKLVNTITTTQVPTGHTISIEGKYLYINGSKYKNGGIVALDLTDPVNPVVVGEYQGAYVHDCIIKNDTIYAAAIYGVGLDMIDATDKANMKRIAVRNYPYSGTHNADLTKDKRYVLTTDEINGNPDNNGNLLRVWDRSDITDLKLVATYVAKPQTIVHNIHIKGDYGYLAHYTEGLRILDLKYPEIPVEIGHYDSFVGSSNSYSGAWGTFPYYASNKVIISDISGGLFVVKFPGQDGSIKTARAVITIRDSVTNLPVSDAKVVISGRTDTMLTNNLGQIRLGRLTDTVTVTISKSTYASGYAAVTKLVSLKYDSVVNVSIALRPLGAGSMKCIALSKSTSQPIKDIRIKISPTPVFGITDAAGNFSVPSLLSGKTYTVTAAKWGFATETSYVQINNGQESVVNLQFAPSGLDDFEIDKGWTVGSPQDSGKTGIWSRSVAAPAVLIGDTLQPKADHSAAGTMSFVTGASPSASDFVEFRTTLTSPVFDPSAFASPTIIFWNYFNTRSAANDDTLYVDLSNDQGSTWKNALSLSSKLPFWKQYRIDLKSVLSVTNGMKIRFVAKDGGVSTIFDASIDDVEFGDNLVLHTETADVLQPNEFVLHQNYPNPFNPSTTIRYQIPAEGMVTLTVYDLLGKELVKLVNERMSPGLHSVDFNAGSYSSGVYFYELRSGSFIETKKLVLMR